MVAMMMVCLQLRSEIFNDPRNRNKSECEERIKIWTLREWVAFFGGFVCDTVRAIDGVRMVLVGGYIAMQGGE